MQRSSTLILKAVIAAIGLIVLAICVFVLPRLIGAELRGDFDYGPIFVGMYVSAIPLFFALYQALKLLGYIDRNLAFSTLSVRAVKYIKYSAGAISALYAAGMPYIFYVADRDDAPGVAAVGFVIIGASLVMAIFAGVLQRLVQHAVDIKRENDLTV
ncbi:MAG TPA: DUF2975 domain-containing protein [Candidatus Saccharimonadales bacterium]|jgi:hypothetical protein